MTRIVVGVDGSTASVRALNWAAMMARTLDGELIVVHAYVPIQSEKPPGLVERLMAERTRELEHWCADALVDIRHKLEVIDGDPRAALTAAVARHQGDPSSWRLPAAAAPSPASFISAVSPNT